jgi:hypothetical protein
VNFKIFWGLRRRGDGVGLGGGREGFLEESEIGDKLNRVDRGRRHLKNRSFKVKDFQKNAQLK